MQISARLPDTYRPALFDANGPVLQVQGAATAYDVGDGVTRISNSSRHTDELVNLRFHGLPAAAQKTATCIRVQIDPAAVHQQMLDEAPPCAGDFKPFAGTSISWRQGEAGASQRTEIVPAPGRDPVQVLSQGPLSETEVRRIGRALAAMPPDGFLQGHTQIHILDWTGEWDYPDGRTETYGGLTFADSGAMFLPRSVLADDEQAQFVIWHETGHIMDALWGHHDEIFTHRSPSSIPTLYHFDDLNWLTPSDASASQYAATGTLEDFAESHCLVIALRSRYAQHHGGADLFHVSDTLAKSYLNYKHLSPALQAKVENVIHGYQGE
ncbi:MAG: hypothetical protein ACYCW6_12105 [Candidatus Xenobia bacterium]